MKILLTGANGYIGKRLLPQLLELGHHVVCCVRDKNRMEFDEAYAENISFVEVDFLEEVNTEFFPKDLDIAYYLIHSMSSSTGNFDEKEALSAENFNKYMAVTSVKQVIYLSGIVNQEELSKHLSSRKSRRDSLSGQFQSHRFTCGHCSGFGSSSFEIIRDLCEKLPLMIAPKWLETRTQPIAIRDVITMLSGVILNEKCYNQSFDIGGPNILTYKEMLQRYSKVRKLKLWIISVPVMTPRLSSYWLYFVTSTTYSLAVNLVER